MLTNFYNTISLQKKICFKKIKKNKQKKSIIENQGYTYQK